MYISQEYHTAIRDARRWPLTSSYATVRILLIISLINFIIIWLFVRCFPQSTVQPQSSLVEHKFTDHTCSIFTNVNLRYCNYFVITKLVSKLSRVLQLVLNGAVCLSSSLKSEKKRSLWRPDLSFLVSNNHDKTRHLSPGQPFTHRCLS